MKILHLSDLHLGKRVNDFSMICDQRHILAEILTIIDDTSPRAVIIAGDIYDKPSPPSEAVAMFDDFLCAIADRGIAALIISGNHDSAERIAFGGRLMTKSGVYMSPIFDGRLRKVTLTDEYGDVNFYLFPFVKPANVRGFFPEEEIRDYTDAMRVVLESTEVDAAERNILIAHQFVTGAAQCDSEDVSVGGLDNVDAAVFEKFDYTALGHIHGPQDIVAGKVRYCGTPLKYSFSEAGHNKSVTAVDIGQKGRLEVSEIPLHPLRDMLELKGDYNTLVSKPFYDNLKRDSYIHITLTDEEDVPDAIIKLRIIYPYIMKLDYDNKRTRGVYSPEYETRTENKTPLEVFADFYESQNNCAMSEEQTAFMRDTIERIWGDAETG